MKLFTVVCVLLLLVVGHAAAQPPPPPPGPGQQSTPVFDPNFQAVENTYTGLGSVTMGTATDTEDLSVTTACTSNERFGAALSGTVSAEDGTEWIVPLEVNPGAACVDIYNSCTGNGDRADFMSELSTVEVDAEGEEISAFIFGDNYFELYINGQYICRDSIGFVPFNSSAARFRASYPITLAVKLVDWETHVGIGMEYDEYKVGDGGFIAYFSDGTVTNADWKCRPAYIAPLDDPACVVEDENGNPDSSACSTSPQCSDANPEACRALHYELPEDWMSPEFDDSTWTAATVYAPEQVTNQPAYTNYASLFGEAEFIWTSNLLLDNQVVCRLTIDEPQE